MKQFLDNKGFTLIELMIVVSIIGLLCAIAIPEFLKYQSKSKQTEARVNLGSMFTSEVAYFSEFNHYSEDLPSTGFSVTIKAKYYDFTASSDYLDLHSGKWIGLHGSPGDGPTGSFGMDPGYEPGATTLAFTAIAVGNIDNDTTMDVWAISSSMGLTAISDDLEL